MLTGREELYRRTPTEYSSVAEKEESSMAFGRNGQRVGTYSIFAVEQKKP